MSSMDHIDLCRLCLVKDNVNVPIFEGEGDVRQIFLKIAACLPVKVTREDKLPKKICDDCVYKVESFYQFWNTTANAEKQLLQWIGEEGIEDKQEYVNVLKQEQNSENTYDNNVIQVSGHQNNMGIGIMDNMGLGIPIIISSTSQQQISSVPLDTSGNSVTQVQAVPGSSAHTPHEQITQSQTNISVHPEEEDESSDDDNMDDECDGDEGLLVKEEGEEDLSSSKNMEQPSYVNVALTCDQAGPSGLQQQKVAEMTDIGLLQEGTEGDPKSGYYEAKLSQATHLCCPDTEIKVLTSDDTELLLAERLQLAKADANGEIISIVQCNFCGEAFVTEEELALHVQKCEELQVVRVIQDEGEDAMQKGTDAEHQQQLLVDSGKSHVCGTCGYSSVHRQNLASHQRRHNLEYKYQCEVCGAGFYARNNYHDHQLVHSREKPFQCDICSATFRYRQGLRLHAKLHQPDYVPPQKKHHCELCNKRFSRKQVLLVHMRTHGNAGPQNEYVCHICGKSVSSKTYLTVHVRKHTGEKPHVCDLCNKAFISQNYLSVHRRTHTGERPHQCTHCNKRFTQRTTLVVHLRGHTGDRPYPCTYCHKSFASKTMLNSHLKTHAKQKARAQQQHHQPHQQPHLLQIDASINNSDHVDDLLQSTID